jgi:UDP-hydrolysing UDP-N-acetyl-D-glucosamine 2-epimerase
MRTIGVVTVARSDYGIYLPLQQAPDLSLHLIVSGMHLSPEFGLTVRTIEKDGFEIADRVEMLLSSDTPEGIAKSIGLGVIGFAQAYSRFRPDILVVLGDRFEMCAAALAALPFKIPLAHIHGGELTQGAIDDALRHLMTKLSHLHFVSTQEYGRRVMQLGEEAWRVEVCGALSLDNLHSVRLLSRKELADEFELFLEDRFLLVTYHPVTLEYEQTEWQVRELVSSLDECGLQVLLTMANADTGGHLVNLMLEDFVRTHPSAQLVDNLGTQAYFSVMALATAMVGNSSSGIIEAGMFKLPVVNIGIRQKGRIRSINVIDVDYRSDEIVRGIKKAISDEFLVHLEQMTNPYGNGHAADHIVRVLRQVELNNRLLVKEFTDYPLNIE